MSTLKDAAIPESFEKLPVDLNAANLRIELNKLRRKRKQDVEEVIKATNPEKARANTLSKNKDESFEINEKLANDQELEEIKHIFVNILLQRSKNPK